MNLLERDPAPRGNADVAVAPPRGWTLVLVVLLLASGVATWRLRVPRAVRLEAAVPAAPAPVIAAPIPVAKKVPGTERVQIPGASPVWTAPAIAKSPATRAARPVVLPAAASLPRTPAGDVDRWVLRLTTGQRGDMQRYLQRMARYQPLIQHALAERGLPRDLLGLALIESGFSPLATSRAGAGGIWQFMPGTARDYGLEVSEFVDERRDPIRATEAALRHLQWLHRRFRSWHLAAAAYNAGDARVGSILLRHTGSTGGREVLYWMVRPYLPTETQEYVPKLLAASRIARAPEAYGFNELQPMAPLAFREVSVPGGVPLSAVADAAGVPPAAVYELNPHLIRRSTPPGRRWPVRIPPESSTPATPIQASR